MSQTTEPGAGRVLERCEHLAKISAIDYGVCRTYLSPEHTRCNAVVAQWMVEAGMRSWQDQAGNCWGRYESKGQDISKPLILGSHLDTVVNAGKYDGILGVLCAIEIIDYLSRNNIECPFPIDVVGFADEEGTRFGATLLGSRAVAGSWDKNWFDLCDKGGVKLSEAMNEFGLHPKDVFLADRSSENILAYLELHIEQGPVLEQNDIPVGIVSSIAGARRFMIRLEGDAGHAGTVPMNMRRDPVCTAAEMVLAIEQIALDANVVATVGIIESFPAAVNVIPGACEFSLDIRSGNDDQRDTSFARIKDQMKNISVKRGTQYSINEIHNAAAVECADWVQELSEKIISDRGLSPLSLVSGAGHDAMAFDGVCDIGMLFLRCAGGVSHNPAESVTTDDVLEGLNVFGELVLALRSRYLLLNSKKRIL